MKKNFDYKIYEVKESKTNKNASELIVEATNKGIANYNEFSRLVREDLSYCWSGMKFLIDEHQAIYDNASNEQKILLEEVDLNEINKQYNIVSCWFQLCEKFQLTELTREDVLQSIEIMDYNNYIFVLDSIQEFYSQTIENLSNGIEKNYEINAELQSIIDQVADFDEDGSFELILESVEDCEKVANYIRVWNDIADAHEKYTEAEEEVEEMLDCCSGYEIC